MTGDRLFVVGSDLGDRDPDGGAEVARTLLLSARVTRDLRRRVLAARRDGETVSDTVRRLLELALEFEAGDVWKVKADHPLGVTLRGDDRPAGGQWRPPCGDAGHGHSCSCVGTGPLGDLDAPPPVHADGPETERTAAADAWPRAGTTRRKLLAYVYAAGDRGVTSDEAVLAVGYSGQRRLHDLKRAGYVEPLRDPIFGAIERRPTRRGSLADVYVLTPAARRRVEQDTPGA